MLKHLKKQNDGFTLIEVILSIAILSIVSVIVLRLFLVSHELNESSRATDHASNLSVNVIETVKGYRSINSYLNDNDWIKSTDEGSDYEGSFIYTDTYAQDPTTTYILLCELKQDSMYETLYDLTVSVTNPKTSELIITYTASHYFVEGVTTP